jgi:hypothetical protein
VNGKKVKVRLQDMQTSRFKVILNITYLSLALAKGSLNLILDKPRSILDYVFRK